MTKTMTETMLAVWLTMRRDAPRCRLRVGVGVGAEIRATLLTMADDARLLCATHAGVHVHPTTRVLRGEVHAAVNLVSSQSRGPDSLHAKGGDGQLNERAPHPGIVRTSYLQVRIRWTAPSVTRFSVLY